MTSSRQALDQVIAQIKEPMYITEYLTACGYDTGKRFSCPNPDHPDKHPSAGLIRSSNRGYCFCVSDFLRHLRSLCLVGGSSFVWPGLGDRDGQVPGRSIQHSV